MPDFNIGNISIHEYQACLNPPSETARRWKTNHWVSHFNLFRYQFLTLLVNRLAYFFLHHFSAYPNNAYLFERFKSHDFKEIKKPEQIETAKQIFECFKCCTEFKPEDIAAIEERLAEAAKQLLPKDDDAADDVVNSETPTPISTPKEPKDEGNTGTEPEPAQDAIQSEDKSVDPDKDKKTDSTATQPGKTRKERREQNLAKEAELKKSQEEKPIDPAKKEVKTPDDTKKDDKAADQTKKDDKLGDSAKKEDKTTDNAKKEDKAGVDQTKKEDKAAAPAKKEVKAGDDPKKDDKPADQAKKDDKSTTQTKTGDELTDDVLDPDALVPKKSGSTGVPALDPKSKTKGATDDKGGKEKSSDADTDAHSDLYSDQEPRTLTLPLPPEEETNKVDWNPHASAILTLSASLDAKSAAVKEASSVEIALPTEVEAIISKPFPLKSLSDLNKDPDAAAEYLKNLTILLAFEKKLQAANQRTRDPRFEAYLEKADDLFEAALKEAFITAEKTLHNLSKGAFKDNPPQLLTNGEVLCTKQQLEWVISTVSSNFPLLYQLAFDSPFLGIEQSQDLAALARYILVGDAAKKLDPPSTCFIRLHPLEQKTTPSVNESKSLFVKAGSYILTQFVGPHRKIKKEAEEVKGQLSLLFKNFVANWFQKSGMVLKFGDKVLESGNSKSTADWVAFVREAYTKKLMTLSKEELQKVLIQFSNCPFLKLLAETYEDEIDSDEWAESKFPLALLEKLFEEELIKAEGDDDLSKAIRQTIDNSSFSDSDDIKTLADLSGFSTNHVEALIRIRIFYLICCLGGLPVESALKGIQQRAKTMYEPSLDALNNALICDATEERLFEFDEFLDKMKLTLKSTFKRPNVLIPSASVKTTIDVQSISSVKKESHETRLIDLEALRFSIFATKAQQRYLIAQILPETLLDNLARLEAAIKDTKLISKGEEFKKAKSDYEKSWNYWAKANYEGCQNEAEDLKRVKNVYPLAQLYVTFLNTFLILKHNDQLTAEQRLAFKFRTQEIRTFFGSAKKVLELIYPTGHPIHLETQKIDEVFATETRNFDVYDMGSDDSPRSSPKPNEGVASFDPDFGRDEEYEIGKRAGKETSSWSVIWNYSIGYFTKETSEVKYFRWKIERYEDLIMGVQRGMRAYIAKMGQGNIPQLIGKAKQPNSPEWLQKLKPILEFCQKAIQTDDTRLTLEYLNEVRKSYTKDFLEQLREAAEWARANPFTDGANHVDALCYQLYTFLDLNQRLENIFDTFIKLGKEFTKGKKIPVHPSLKGEPQYAIINDLYEAHQLISAVPNEAKAPLLKQWANSLLGHLNGVWKLASFDPNMQSNPIHVFYNQIIKETNGTTVTTREVKDIAMGSPTIEDGNGVAQVNEEFQGFLRHCQRNKLVHAYFNDQDFRPKSMIEGDESPRCQALHDKAEKEFKGTLIVVTQSQNSPFYYQRGHEINRRVVTAHGIQYESELNIEINKKAIFDQLLDGKNKTMRHYLPAHLKSDVTFRQWMIDELNRLHKKDFDLFTDFRFEEDKEEFIENFHKSLKTHVEDLLSKKPSTDGKGLGYSIYHSSAAVYLNELIEQKFDRSPHETGNKIPKVVGTVQMRDWSVKMATLMHQKLFGGRAELTVGERRIFNRLFDRTLTRKILVESKANSYNRSCKDRIDRGASDDSEDYAYSAIINNVMNHPKVIAFFKFMVFARSIVVRKRSIIEERLEREIETIKFMIDLQTELRDFHAQVFPDVEITVDQFSETEEMPTSD